MEDEEENLAKASRKTLKKGLMANRLFLIAIVAFIAGIIMGAYLEHSFIEDLLFQSKEKDYKALLEKNLELDKTVDKYYKCIIDKEINPDDC